VTAHEHYERIIFHFAMLLDAAEVFLHFSIQ